jgi:hypothetical protein
MNSRQNALKNAKKKRSLGKPRSGEIFIAQGEPASPGHPIQNAPRAESGIGSGVCAGPDQTSRFNHAHTRTPILSRLQR